MSSLVMTTRYAGASEIRAVSEHEKNRTPDGYSAIDPKRSHRNRNLLGPKQKPGRRPLSTQYEALLSLFESGVKKPATQAERPFVQMVLSASPEYFRGPGQGPGEWDPKKLSKWIGKTMPWLKAEYGSDAVHASLHLDEDTPHIHVLIVPTYQKKPRVPGRRTRTETAEEFKARKAAAKSGETVRCVGRSSNTYWSRKWAKREARKSYARALEPLKIGYGRDFVAEGQQSPERKTTAQYVRERAAELGSEYAKINTKTEELDQRHISIELDQLSLSIRAEELQQSEREIKEMRLHLHEREIELQSAHDRAMAIAEENIEKRSNLLKQREASLTEREIMLQRAEKALPAIFERMNNIVADLAFKLGIESADSLSEMLLQLEDEVRGLRAASSAPHEPVESGQEAPGF